MNKPELIDLITKKINRLNYILSKVNDLRDDEIIEIIECWNCNETVFMFSPKTVLKKYTNAVRHGSEVRARQMVVPSSRERFFRFYARDALQSSREDEDTLEKLS